MSLSLKHIPCPAGDHCTAFQCIFGHESDRSPSSTSKAAEECEEGAQIKQDVLPTDPDRPRKRQKTQSSSDTSSSGGVSISSSHSGASLKRSRESSLDEQPPSVPGKSQPALGPISPPPVKRSPIAVSNPATAASSSATPSPASKASRPSVLSATKTATSAKPRKPETLNPRLLKSSPASHEMRLKLLKLVHAEYKRLNTELKKDGNDEELKLVLTDQDLIFRALDEEQKCAVEKPAVYTNVMKNKIMQFKRMSVPLWKDLRIKEVQASKKQSQAASGDGEPKVIQTGLDSLQEVELLSHILTPITNLIGHGYISSVPTEEQIQAIRDGLDAAKGWEKCDRCQRRFQVFPGRREEDGALTTGGSCNFHWGKTYVPDKLPGDRTRVPKRYHCCGQEVGDSAGCFTHEHHVFKASNPKRLAATLNFAQTPENPLAPTDRAVCFDCEMCYTVYGMEIVRLTATSWPDGEEILDVLVQPLGEVLDLNSRFSGVWPEDLANAEPWTADDNRPRPTNEDSSKGRGEGGSKSSKKLKIVSSPEVARDLLFSLISPTTPLIGHGLENDLNAVRVVHPTVIDTILLYPHKMGLPYRYGLKYLMNLHLNRKIQQETGPRVLGHDSAEDARAAGELVRLRIMDTWNDMKRKGWQVVDGVITPPEGQGRLTEKFIEG